MTKDRATLMWKEKIERLTAPPTRAEQSPARARIHANFDEIAAARDRGVTWQQLTDLFTSEGVVAVDGEPLTADAVRSLFHTERYSRGGRRKRQKSGKTSASLQVNQATTERLNASEPAPKPVAEPVPTQTYSDAKALARAKLKAQMIPIRKKE